jgi:hypothetical protein
MQNAIKTKPLTITPSIARAAEDDAGVWPDYLDKLRSDGRGSKQQQTWGKKNGRN